jgi:IPT/TIG domain-containing protein
VVWLGTTLGAVVSWSDTQIAATVAPGSATGTAQVRQNGTWSNSVPFTVIAPTITSVSPTSGLPGTQVTITGSGFGAVQGSGQVLLGTMTGVVQSWSDTQVMAQVKEVCGTALWLSRKFSNLPQMYT